jgi:hypothetical protein
MSSRSKRGTGSRRSRKPLVATAAAIGGAGAPAAGLLAASGIAQAAPVIPAPQQFGDLIPGGGDFFGGAGLAALLDPLWDITGLIPVINIFAANGVDGTADNPNGTNAGLFFGSGGDGLARPHRAQTAATAVTPGCSSATAATAVTALLASMATTV